MISSNDLFSLAAIALDRSLPGCESGFRRARASQNGAALRSEAFFTLGTRTNIWGIINANGHGAAAGGRVFCCFSRHARMARSQPIRANEVQLRSRRRGSRSFRGGKLRHLPGALIVRSRLD